MKTAEKRQALREAGIPVRRSSADVDKDYEELQEKTVLEQAEVKTEKPEMVTGGSQSPVKLVSDNIYTYVGAGEEPPHMINFMGLQKFIRGQAVEVSNPLALEKIQANRCFVKGKVDMDELFKNDEKERYKADEQRERDRQTQIRIDRVNKGRG